MFFQVLDDSQAAGAALAVDRHEDLAFSVHEHAGGLNGRGVLGISDVAEKNRRATQGQRHGIEVLHSLEHGVRVEEHFVGSEIGGARRYHEIAPAEGLDHGRGNEIAGLHAEWVKVDHDGAIASTEHNWSDAALHGSEHVADIDAGDVLLAGIVHAGVRDCEDSHRKRAGGIEGQSNRRQCVRRKIRQRAESERVHQCERLVRIDVLAELDLDHAHARHRARFHKPRPRGLTHPAFKAVGDRFLDRCRRHPRVVGQHLHGGRLEHREDIDGNPNQRHRPQNHDGGDQGEHHVRIAERCLDEPHGNRQDFYSFQPRLEEEKRKDVFRWRCPE